MKQSWLFFLSTLLITGLAACAPVTPASPETAPPSEPAQPAAGFYPLTTRTGIAEIDDVLQVVASGNVEELRSLIQFTNTKCTQQDGLGGPPKCREGEAEGAPVEALPFLGSEGSFLRKDEFENWQGVDVSGLYAVYEDSPEVYADEYYPAGEHTVLLVGKRDAEPIALRISGGRIVRIDYLTSFGSDSLDAILEREAANLILPPANR